MIRTDETAFALHFVDDVLCLQLLISLGHRIGIDASDEASMRTLGS